MVARTVTLRVEVSIFGVTAVILPGKDLSEFVKVTVTGRPAVSEPILSCGTRKSAFISDRS